MGSFDAFFVLHTETWCHLRGSELLKDTFSFPTGSSGKSQTFKIFAVIQNQNWCVDPRQSAQWGDLQQRVKFMVADTFRRQSNLPLTTLRGFSHTRGSRHARWWVVLWNAYQGRKKVKEYVVLFFESFIRNSFSFNSSSDVFAAFEHENSACMESLRLQDPFCLEKVRRTV